MTAPTRIGAGNGSGMAVVGGRGRPQAVAQHGSLCPPCVVQLSYSIRPVRPVRERASEVRQRRSL